MNISEKRKGALLILPYKTYKFYYSNHVSEKIIKNKVALYSNHLRIRIHFSTARGKTAKDGRFSQSEKGNLFDDLWHKEKSILILKWLEYIKLSLRANKTPVTATICKPFYQKILDEFYKATFRGKI